MTEYHVPVMAGQAVEFLVHDPDGVYVDVTFGGGGHAREILKKLSAKGRLICLDQDADAARNLFGDARLDFHASNFRFLKKVVRLAGVKQVDGILADLGVSSHQFDEASRGFSFRFDARLDMRMNRGVERDAAQILRDYPESELVRVFSEYGEVRNAKSLAAALVRDRAERPLQTVQDLLSVLRTCSMGDPVRYQAQVFQALRIEVNEELEALAEMLEAAMQILKPGGRLVVISYHSLEDRMVKHFMQAGNREGKVETDFYGKRHLPFRILTKKPLEAGAEEIRLNPRSRSAKLRVAERILEN